MDETYNMIVSSFVLKPSETKLLNDPQNVCPFYFTYDLPY